MEDLEEGLATLGRSGERKTKSLSFKRQTIRRWEETLPGIGRWPFLMGREEYA